MKNLEKSYIKCGGEASPRHFYKKSKLNTSLNQQPEMLHSLIFVVSPSGGLPNSLKQNC